MTETSPQLVVRVLRKPGRTRPVRKTWFWPFLIFLCSVLQRCSQHVCGFPCRSTSWGKVLCYCSAFLTYSSLAHLLFFKLRLLDSQNSSMWSREPEFLCYSLVAHPSTNKPGVHSWVAQQGSERDFPRKHYRVCRYREGRDYAKPALD